MLIFSYYAVCTVCDECLRWSVAFTMVLGDGTECTNTECRSNIFSGYAKGVWLGDFKQGVYLLA
jgi:hypothetical protein